jgi:multidrug efflux system membrane fusion protein
MTVSRRQFLGASALAVAAAAGGYYWLSASPKQPAQTGRGRRRGGASSNDTPVPVLATTAALADVPIYLDGVGTVSPLNTVTVKPQVDGKLISISFKEGEDVKKGQVIARLDPTTYQAQLDQAVAKKAQDAAQLANAKLDLVRYVKLAATNSATKQQADTQSALVAQLEAQVDADQGAIDNARAMLAYTTITAPLSGRTGLRQVDVGNIVHASDATGLVVITELKPIGVIFNLPQQQLPQVNAAFEKGLLPVDAMRSDTGEIIDHGKLTVIDNQVDQTTGTVKLKAEFPNDKLALWPGQFVNVRMLVDTLKQVVVVPTASVQRGPDGAFVYLVTQGNTASVRKVDVTRQDDVQAVIGKGVAKGDSVVTTGFAQLSDGHHVTVATSPEGNPPADTPAANKRRGRRSGGQTNNAGGGAGASSGGQTDRNNANASRGGSKPSGTPATGATRTDEAAPSAPGTVATPP